MKIAIFGLGYVGSTAAGCLASQGHTIVGVDIAQSKIDAFNAGQSPVHEAGLDDLLASGHQGSLIKATQDVASALADADIAMVCVGTPSGPDGAHDMSHIVNVTRSIAKNLPADRKAALTLVYRSTMRPGSCENIIWPLLKDELGEAASAQIELVYNPEFLREASAIEDYFNPPKIVIGTGDAAGSKTMNRLYAGIDLPERFYRWRTVSRQVSKSRSANSCFRSRRPSKKQGFVIATSRWTCGDELKWRNGLAGFMAIGI